MPTGREPTALDNFRQELYRLQKDDIQFYQAAREGRALVVMSPDTHERIMADPAVRSQTIYHDTTGRVNAIMGVRFVVDSAQEGLQFYTQASAS